MERMDLYRYQISGMRTQRTISFQSWKAKKGKSKGLVEHASIVMRLLTWLTLSCHFRYFKIFNVLWP